MYYLTRTATTIRTMLEYLSAVPASFVAGVGQGVWQTSTVTLVLTRSLGELCSGQDDETDKRYAHATFCYASHRQRGGDYAEDLRYTCHIQHNGCKLR